MQLLSFLIGFLAIVVVVEGRGLNRYPHIKRCIPFGPTGDPLFLTPYIESGRAAEGRKAAVVPPLLEEVESFSGYLTVNKKYGGNLFFWYFLAEEDSSHAPVMLWLQGGPGGSSMFGLFQEHGSFVIDKNLTVTRRRYSWTKAINVIYIDNPVGTGFSFTRDSSGYVTTEEEVGRDLYSALVQFFHIFPEVRGNEFFIAGESYAGKYIPALAYTIHVNNPDAFIKINLQGIAIGDGLIDPQNMLEYGDYLYQHGIIDDKGRQEFHEKEQQIRRNIENDNYEEASKEFEQLFFLLNNLAGDIDVYNYLIDGQNEISGDIMGRFLCQAQIRKRIHVGNLDFNDGKVVERFLLRDVTVSVKPYFQVLMEHYRVLLYSGQLDVIVAYPLTLNFVGKLDWSGADDYRTASRKKWFVGGKLAGFSKSARNFTEVLVRDAGHMVPSDQPEWAFDMIMKFLNGRPF